MSSSAETLQQPTQLSIGGLGSAMGVTGRILFSIPFIMFGFFHFMGAKAMAGMVPAWIPGSGVFWIVLTGAALVAGGVSIASNRLVKLAAPLMALMVTIFILTIHVPGLAEEATRQMAMISALKDLSLVGAMLFIASKAK